MIIDSLTLQNFGVYEGKNEIIFPKNGDKNIIVVIGKNGSGKTTILEALKIALYGPLLFGYKTVNESYLEKIKEKFNNRAYENKGECSLNLKFSKVENSVNVEYKIFRKWKLSSKSLSEEMTIHRNGTQLSELEINILENYLRQFLPPSLIDLFFFDGERLSYLSETEILQSKLKESVDIIFNIGIFSQLIKDLNQVLKQKEIDSELSDEEKKLRNLREETENLLNQFEELTNIRQSKKIKLQELNDNIQALKNEMSLHGALEKEELVNLRVRYNEMERDKEILNKRKKEILSSIFPFQISRNLLLQLKQHIEYELVYSQTDTIKKTLKTDNLLKIAVKNALGEQSDILLYLDEFVDKIIMNIEKKRKHEDKKRSANLQLTNFMSKEDVRILEDLVNKTGQNLVEEMDHLFKNINQINKEINDLRKKINLNIQNKSFEQLFEEIENKKNDQFILSQEIIKMNDDLDKFHKEKNIVDREIEKLDKQIDYINRSNSVSSVTNKIIKVSSDFIAESRDRKLAILEEKILVLFKSLIRKDDLLKNIKLFSDYRIDFQNGSANPLKFNQLSTGEKQIFIIAILWALIQLSQRTFPVVFDSFFGRLDQSHKESILSKFVPNSQRQVILLVNDNEMNTSDLDLFSKYNVIKYKLIFNEKNKNSSIERI